MIPAMQIFMDVIRYESNKICEYKLIGKANNSMTIKAYKHIEEKSIVRYRNQFIYTRLDGKNETIVATKTIKTCTCTLYFDKAMCTHLIAGCIMNEICIEGLRKKVILFSVSKNLY